MNNLANRLLKALHQLTDGDPTNSTTLITASGLAKISDPPAEVFRSAIILEAKGFIRLERSATLGEIRLQITGAGVAEAARLDLPFWKRWASDRDLVQKVVLLAIGALFGVAGGVAVKLLIS
jgi:hypothetical protein